MDRNAFSVVPDELWAMVEPVIPRDPPRPRGGRGRVPARQVFAGIVYRLRTGCQWKAIPRDLVDGGTCHRRFTEWNEAGVFAEVFRVLLAYDDRRVGIAWRWGAMDGALVKAPKGGPRPGRTRPIARNVAVNAAF